MGILGKMDKTRKLESLFALTRNRKDEEYDFKNGMIDDPRNLELIPNWVNSEQNRIIEAQGGADWSEKIDSLTKG